MADGKLIILKEDGQLVLVRASHTDYVELDRANVFSGTTRALPALARGLLVARDTQTLKCLALQR
jgi:hypothetical protein